MRVILVVAAAVTLAAMASAASSRPGVAPLFLARACTGSEFDEEAELCDTNDRGKVLRTDEVVCSVDQHVERRTRLTIRILYEGEVQETVSRTVDRSSRPTWLRLRFPNLHYQSDPQRERWGLPAGRYACDFRLGPHRALVPFRGGGSTEPILAPHACRPLGNGTPIEYVCDGAVQGHSIACTAVFARKVGHRIGVQILRGQGANATLLYEGSDVATVPIAAEWAYTSAPGGGFMPLGEYECRFLVDGRVAVATPFALQY